MNNNKSFHPRDSNGLYNYLWDNYRLLDLADTKATEFDIRPSGT